MTTQSQGEGDAEAAAAQLDRGTVAQLELDDVLDVPTTFTISCRLYVYKVNRPQF